MPAIAPPDRPELEDGKAADDCGGLKSKGRALNVLVPSDTVIRPLLTAAMTACRSPKDFTTTVATILPEDKATSSTVIFKDDKEPVNEILNWDACC